MAVILWLDWQVRHIEQRHGVSAQEFEEAWDDPAREDLAEEEHPEWGPCFLSLGSTSGGRLIAMLWRWQHHDGGAAVWPITAYFKDIRPAARRQRRPRRRR